jgi:hypothetical protein
LATIGAPTFGSLPFARSLRPWFLENPWQALALCHLETWTLGSRILQCTLACRAGFFFYIFYV